MSLNGFRVFPEHRPKNDENNNYINEYLKNGGNNNMVGDYSSEVTCFCYTATKKTKISRMIIYIEDAGTINFNTYGGLSELTNGVRVYYKQQPNGKTNYLDAGYSIKTNGNWAKMCYDIEIKAIGSGNSEFSARWTFAASGTTIYLNVGGEIGVELNDNLTGLIEHKIIVQGFDFN